MPQSLSRVLVHLIFSTKHGAPVLQEEHHRKISFQEEYRNFLARHRVDYDERYVWD